MKPIDRIAQAVHREAKEEADFHGVLCCTFVFARDGTFSFAADANKEGHDRIMATMLRCAETLGHKAAVLDGEATKAPLIVRFADRIADRSELLSKLAERSVEHVLIEDDDGHWYVCPADKIGEAQAYFQADSLYWTKGGAFQLPDKPTWLLAIRRREQELFAAHGAGWFGPTGCITPPNDREHQSSGEWRIVRRGFVATVLAPLTVLIDRLPAILRREPVEAVDVTDLEPRRSPGGFDWLCVGAFTAAREWVRGPAVNSIPVRLWKSDRLTFDSLGRPTRETIVFTSEESARAALSEVILSCCRSIKPRE